jgi:hypothetical protein
MRSVSQQGFSRRVEYGCERCRVSKRGARSNLAVKRPARGRVVPPTLYHHSGPEGILFHDWSAGLLPAFLR